MASAEGLREIAGYAELLGPPTRTVIPLAADGGLGSPTPLLRQAHAAGLQVWPYTFRPENAFLPPALRQGALPGTRSEAGAIAELRAYLEAGIDGFFTDDSALGRAAVDGVVPTRK